MMVKWAGFFEVVGKKTGCQWKEANDSPSEWDD